ncbi:MAG TPA: hypothetical protein VIX87_01255 [Steroidobacteraceae bacterium]
MSVQLQRIAPHAGQTPGCIVLLPGVGQQPGDFLTAGFDAALRERALPWELILAAPELAHLADRSWLEALREQVVEPAHAAGRSLWLGGISMGAFMALRFAARHPALVDGLCLLGPYLGNRIVAAEIARFDPLQSWEPGALAEDEDERQIWRYVRNLHGPRPRMFLGFGRDDRFADTQRLLARSLPSGSVAQIEGAHEWPAWRQLWDNFLDRHLAHTARVRTQP